MTGATRVVAVAALLLGGAACANGDGDLPLPGPVPFADTLPIREPEERSYRESTELLKASVKEEIAHSFSVARRLSDAPEALNVTALDGVVPSAWFEPRITAREMGPEEVAQGPPGAAPAPRGPLVVVDAKVTGVSPGFTVRDRKGDHYLLKFDPPGFPGLASAADVVSSRIFWAAGYHVPKDVVFTLDPGRMEIGEEATLETERGPRPMEPGDVIEVLRRIDPLPDGRFRALASRFVDGVPKGPFRFEGTREDDPNDYYPHEDRRELRGLWVLASWVAHVDLRFANTLDVWVDPPGFLRHYLIDFGATLGSRSIRVANPREGQEYAFDLWPVLGRIATLGFYRVGWEALSADPIRPSLGWIATETFDPGSWKPFWPNDAYRRMTVRDAYWGAKLVAAFREAHLRAAVREARYPDPAAADTLLAILRYRRRTILEHWLGRVTPVENVWVEDAGCRLRVGFEDLGLKEGLWAPAETRYRWRLRGAGAGVSEGETAAAPGARQVLSLPSPGRAGEGREPGSAVLEITALRPGTKERAARITIRSTASGYRIARLVH
ncbi:MAG: hypothetical protein GWM92_02745 [Gemmatimonadetes bacterium]|nr:hypothetical protein [Gemmatimonadota bacterium]NIR77420.1 hypothetical protein [Gemmatimonadota bacterium]NIT85941.1 hypothetical protein [Gemmatimonadota bacterium]NIU29761.1 hypothetical protein [Gemmatimonadota bacterium]NIU34794.1 hypothetical protein [Gemmatimonadota bacterium]